MVALGAPKPQWHALFWAGAATWPSMALDISQLGKGHGAGGPVFRVLRSQARPRGEGGMGLLA